MRAIHVMPAMREWYEQNVAQPQRDHEAMKRAELVAFREDAKVFTPIDADEKRAIEAIRFGRVNYAVGSFHKRFARDVQERETLTDAQRVLLWSMVVRFRRQIDDSPLIQLARQKLAQLNGQPQSTGKD